MKTLRNILYWLKRTPCLENHSSWLEKETKCIVNIVNDADYDFCIGEDFDGNEHIFLKYEYADKADELYQITLSDFMGKFELVELKEIKYWLNSGNI